MGLQQNTNNVLYLVHKTLMWFREAHWALFYFYQKVVQPTTKFHNQLSHPAMVLCDSVVVGGAKSLG